MVLNNMLLIYFLSRSVRASQKIYIGGLACDVIKNMTMQIMINLPQILV